MRKVMGVVLISVTLVGCKMQNVGMSQEDLLSAKYSSIAAKYVENIILRAKIAEGKALNSKEYPEFFESIVKIENGEETKTFREFTQFEQVKAVNDWKKSETERIAERFEKYPELAEMTEAENRIEDATLAEIEKLGREYIVEDYIRIRESKVKEFLESKKSVTCEEIENNLSPPKALITDINQSLLSQYRANYKKGRILINVETTGGGSSFAGLGHAALMSENSWNPAWNYDNYAYTSIGAWGCASSSGYWNGAASCVQYEPLSYWTGSQGLCPEVTIIYDVYDASESQYSTAAEWARTLLGKPYFFSVKGDIASFYCSKVVWYSWFITNSSCGWGDMYWVLPCDIANAANTIPVVSYKNR